MQDLTKITTPFGLLDKETQGALRSHEGPIEYYNGLNWGEVARKNWSNTGTYRAKREPMTIWVNEYECGTLGRCHTCFEIATLAANGGKSKRTIKFVEVIE